MMKISTFFLFAFVLLTFTPTAFANRLVVAECVAQGDRFSQDSCRTVAAKTSNDCSVSFSRGVVSVSSTEFGARTGQSVLSARIGSPFERRYEGNAEFTRHDLNFGGLNRGMAILQSVNQTVTDVLRVEIYLNHDRSGQSYTRLSCSGR